MVLPRMRAFILSALWSGALLLPSLASAQAVGSTAPFSLSVSPQYPAPYSQVVITPSSGTLDLSNTSFTLSVNGKQLYAGNAQPIAVTLGGAGSVTTVEGVLTSAGTSYTQDLSVQPEDVSLVAEPLSSAPPLYQGKPLIPLEGSVRVVAMANLRTAGGTALDPNTLSYAWTIDGTEITSSSGIGKDAIIAAVPLQYRESDISVVVESQDGSLIGGDTLALNPQVPTVRIYAEDPLLGILFDHALSGSYSLSGTEGSFYGAAYSFPSASGAPVLSWFLNGASAQSGDSITLRPTGQGAGSASISLEGAGGSDSTATENLSILFGGTSSTNIFGL